MTKGAGRSGEETSQAAGAAPGDLLAAYLEAVAHRDQWVHAYVTVCLYEPASAGRGSDWHFELITD
jgi:hypothetical protein